MEKQEKIYILVPTYDNINYQFTYYKHDFILLYCNAQLSYFLYVYNIYFIVSYINNRKYGILIEWLYEILKVIKQTKLWKKENKTGICAFSNAHDHLNT